VKSDFLLAAASLIFIGSIATSASAPQAQKAPPKLTPELLAKSVGDYTAEEEDAFSQATEATMERVCITCHPFENIIKTRRTAREWNDQVTTMAQRGAPGTEPEFTAIKKYLKRYYGMVRVNTASAEELSDVLGLSSKAAAAVVEYRTAHGKFTDLASLEKVDGVEKAKLQEEPEALRFDQ
jgi:competence ComEA-like helix-hairpin-helix protein